MQKFTCEEVTCLLVGDFAWTGIRKIRMSGEGLVLRDGLGVLVMNG